MDQPITHYNGLRLVETTTIIKLVRSRTHRKRRIDKKWLKKYGYKAVPDDSKIYIFDGCVYASPNTIKKIIEDIKKG